MPGQSVIPGELVRKPQFIKARLVERDMFIESIMTRGVVLYEGQHP